MNRITPLVINRRIKDFANYLDHTPMWMTRRFAKRRFLFWLDAGLAYWVGEGKK